MHSRRIFGRFRNRLPIYIAQITVFAHIHLCRILICPAQKAAGIWRQPIIVLKFNFLLLVYLKLLLKTKDFYHFKQNKIF
jgi:hypothetical protein